MAMQIVTLTNIFCPANNQRLWIINYERQSSARGAAVWFLFILHPPVGPSGMTGSRPEIDDERDENVGGKENQHEPEWNEDEIEFGRSTLQAKTQHDLKSHHEQRHD